MRKGRLGISPVAKRMACVARTFLSSGSRTISLLLFRQPSKRCPLEFRCGKWAWPIDWFRTDQPCGRERWSSFIGHQPRRKGVFQPGQGRVGISDGTSTPGNAGAVLRCKLVVAGCNQYRWPDRDTGLHRRICLVCYPGRKYGPARHPEIIDWPGFLGAGVHLRCRLSIEEGLACWLATPDDSCLIQLTER